MPFENACSLSGLRAAGALRRRGRSSREESEAGGARYRAHRGARRRRWTPAASSECASRLTCLPAGNGCRNGIPCPCSHGGVSNLYLPYTKMRPLSPDAETLAEQHLTPRRAQRHTIGLTQTLQTHNIHPQQPPRPPARRSIVAGVPQERSTTQRLHKHQSVAGQRLTPIVACARVVQEKLPIQKRSPPGDLNIRWQEQSTDMRGLPSHSS